MLLSRPALDDKSGICVSPSSDQIPPQTEADEPTATATVTQRVAEFVAGFELEGAPEEVVEKAKVTVLHNLGVAMAGHGLAGPAYQVAKEFGACEGGGARLLVDGTRVTVEHAAIATGALMHARTQDDTLLSAGVHLGCTTLPALLALSDRDDRSGRDFLTAMIVGYEAAAAIAVDYAAKSTARGFRPTSIYGPFASAAGCARLLGLTSQQTAAALGLAASFAGGTLETAAAGTQEWQYQVGLASRNGLIAALLAERGVSAAPSALEGRAGHYRSFAGAQEVPDAIAASSLGSKWQTMDVRYKPFPICAINQVPVTAMIELAVRHDICERDVETITLTLSPPEATYPGVDNRGPFTSVVGTLMSVQYCLAVAVRKRALQLADLRDLEGSSLMSLIRRIQVLPDQRVPRNSCYITVRARGSEMSTEYTNTSATFNWDRDETIGQLQKIVGDMPFDRSRLDELVNTSLDLENRTIRELVSITFA